MPERALRSLVRVPSHAALFPFVKDERNRAPYVLKSRGMAHSNQIREFVLTDHGG